jgi:transposase InsO family protein
VYCEGFNGRLWDECLNQNWFTSLDDAWRIIEAWRVDYNTVRPHSSLRYLTPEEYAATVAVRQASPPTTVVFVTSVWAQTDVQEPPQC